MYELDRQVPDSFYEENRGQPARYQLSFRCVDGVEWYGDVQDQIASLMPHWNVNEGLESAWFDDMPSERDLDLIRMLFKGTVFAMMDWRTTTWVFVDQKITPKRR